MNADFGVGVIICLFIIAALTMPAGIGGGILFTPLLQTSANMQTKYAVALSQVLITGAASASILFSINKQLNNRDDEGLRVQAHYVFLSLPPLLSGTLVGIYMGKLLPGILQMLALFFICSYGSYSILKKALKTYNEETAALTKPASSGTVLGALPSSASATGHVQLPEEEGKEVVKTTPKMLSTIGEELPPLDIRKFVIFMAVFFFGTILLTFMKGGKGSSSILGVSPCGFWFWLIVLLQVSAELGASLYYSPKEYKFILQSWGIGIITTMTGASPGVLQNPLMMSYGLSPVYSTPISVITTFITASTSALDYLMSGVLPFWVVFLSIITFCGSIAGMTGVSWLINKTGRPSIIIFLLGVMAGLGGLTVLLSGATGTWNAIKNGDNPLYVELTC